MADQGTDTTAAWRARVSKVGSADGISDQLCVCFSRDDEAELRLRVYTVSLVRHLPNAPLQSAINQDKDKSGGHSDHQQGDRCQHIVQQGRRND